MKFHLKALMIVNLQSGLEKALQRSKGNNSKNIQTKLWFLCMTHCFIVLYNCMNIQPNSFNSVQLTERTRNCIYLCYKGDNLKNIHARVMVLMHDTSSQCALQMYEVSLKYL